MQQSTVVPLGNCHYQQDPLLEKHVKTRDGGTVGLSILCTQAQKAGLETVPYPSEYLIMQLKDLMSKAYKQFWQLKRQQLPRYMDCTANHGTGKGLELPEMDSVEATLEYWMDM